MSRILNDFISLFFPRTCIGCKKVLISSEQHICLHCKISFPLTDFHKDDVNPLKKRLHSIDNLRQAFAYLKYNKEGIAQKMLHQLKYDGDEALGYKLGLWMGYEIENEINKFDIIIPVPLHPKKLALRGFNQSDSICKGLSESLNIPWDNQLINRTKFNPTQTKKSKIDRWLNVEQLFAVSHKERLEGKHILIVDDVITTGATIESVAKIASNAGVESISIACIASGQ